MSAQLRPSGEDAHGGQRPAGADLAHLGRGSQGSEARMVDVGSRAATPRTALARALVRFPSGLLERVLEGSGPKGPVEEVARIAGIQAAKRTSEWIPMCHPLPLEHLSVSFGRLEPDLLEVRFQASATARTGVEMEALVGASAAALTVYDMTKSLSKAIAIERVELLEKSGGKSGPWRRGS